jgi:hypothetical protein
MKTSSTSSVNRSRISPADISNSRCRSAGARALPDFFSIFCHSRVRCRMSAAYSASPLPSPAVRAITPTPLGFRSDRMALMRCRSARSSMRRDTPMWSTPGMSTQKRPGRLTCCVTRGPFVPMDSLVIWTRTSWPFFKWSSIFGTGARRRRLGSPVISSASDRSSSPDSDSARSEACRNPVLGRPMSTNADCMPGSTAFTRAL